jgi:hypothetical protein
MAEGGMSNAPERCGEVAVSAEPEVERDLSQVRASGQHDRAPQPQPRAVAMNGRAVDAPEDAAQMEHRSFQRAGDDL